MTMRQVWLPVMSATGIVLPPAIELNRFSVSDAAGGVVASGAILLGGAEDDERGGQLALA